LIWIEGPKAPGGAYLRRPGKMIGGFAPVACPAEYCTSDVMTFVVNHDGAVLQKDLGAGTAGIASGMSGFNHDDLWKKVVP
jgi:Protein of unknown function (DUF2950)